MWIEMKDTISFSQHYLLFSEIIHQSEIVYLVLKKPSLNLNDISISNLSQMN